MSKPKSIASFAEGILADMDEDPNATVPVQNLAESVGQLDISNVEADPDIIDRFINEGKSTGDDAKATGKRVGEFRKDQRAVRKQANKVADTPGLPDDKYHRELTTRGLSKTKKSYYSKTKGIIDKLEKRGGRSNSNAFTQSMYKASEPNTNESAATDFDRLRSHMRDMQTMGGPKRQFLYKKKKDKEKDKSKKKEKSMEEEIKERQIALLDRVQKIIAEVTTVGSIGVNFAGKVEDPMKEKETKKLKRAKKQYNVLRADPENQMEETDPFQRFKDKVDFKQNIQEGLDRVDEKGPGFDEIQKGDIRSNKGGGKAYKYGKFGNALKKSEHASIDLKGSEGSGDDKKNKGGNAKGQKITPEDVKLVNDSDTPNYSKLFWKMKGENYNPGSGNPKGIRVTDDQVTTKPDYMSHFPGKSTPTPGGGDPKSESPRWTTKWQDLQDIGDPLKTNMGEGTTTGAHATSTGARVGKALRKQGDETPDHKQRQADKIGTKVGRRAAKKYGDGDPQSDRSLAAHFRGLYKGAKSVAQYPNTHGMGEGYSTGDSPYGTGERVGKFSKNKDFDPDMIKKDISIKKRLAKRKKSKEGKASARSRYKKGKNAGAFDMPEGKTTGKDVFATSKRVGKFLAKRDPEDTSNFINSTSKADSIAKRLGKRHSTPGDAVRTRGKVMDKTLRGNIKGMRDAKKEMGEGTTTGKNAYLTGRRTGQFLSQKYGEKIPKKKVDQARRIAGKSAATDDLGTMAYNKVSKESGLKSRLSRSGDGIRKGRGGSFTLGASMGRRFPDKKKNEGRSTGEDPIATGKRVGKFKSKNNPIDSFLGYAPTAKAEKEMSKEKNIRKRVIKRHGPGGGLKFSNAKNKAFESKMAEGLSTGGNPELTGQRVGRAVAQRNANFQKPQAGA